MKKIFLSVVIPCYNEEANLKKGVLTEVADYLKKQKYSWEVIISDDGSTDKSPQLAADFAKKNPGFIHLKNKHGGKAAALWAGIKKARGKILLTTDTDQSTPIKEIEKLLPWFKKGYQVVIGSRGLTRKGFPWYRRYLTTPIFKFLRGLFLLPEIDDTQCGFKAYQARMARNIFPQLEVLREEAVGWRVSAFDVELLFIAKRSGLMIKEVVVNWRDRDISTTKGKNFFKESKSMVKEIWRVKLNDWQGKYDQ
jgi:glycosyltransferase involved in cell wall biosynthesis